jgi:7-carboxy-7-deazaguanine synthase
VHLPVHQPDDGADGAPTRATAGSVLISETFVSVQGEGLLTGVPSWFCRASGCNLRCAWCDTPYASWTPEGATRSVDDLLAECLSSGVRHAVLTGGEPLLFAGMLALSARLRGAGVHVTAETAGTVDPGATFDLLSLSPKLASSAPAPGDERDPSGAWRARHEARRINLPALRALIERHGAPGARQIKFVATRQEDLAEIEALIKQLPPVQPSEVLLMPEGVQAPTPEHRAWVLRACAQRGWRYCHRLHIELFGHTRGT